MKKFFAIITLLISAALAPTAAAQPAAPAHDDAKVMQATRSVAAAPDVLVELSLDSGDVIVRGWNRKEVRAQSAEAAKIELRQYESAETPKGEGKGEAARRVEVFVLSSEDDEPRPGESGGSGDVELDVPSGATVVLKLQSGDVEISGVAGARVKSASGDVDIINVSRGVDIDLFSGDITLIDSRGDVRLKSQSGDVEAVNITPNDNRDIFTVESTSGDITLESVGHAKVEGKTMSGTIRFDGPLAKGGGYTLRVTSGDVTMMLPESSSFTVAARIITGGEIITDFPVKADAKTMKGIAGSRLEGVVGTGSANLNLTSHNGTVHLRRK